MNQLEQLKADLAEAQRQLAEATRERDEAQYGLESANDALAEARRVLGSRDEPFVDMAITRLLADLANAQRQIAEREEELRHLHNAIRGLAVDSGVEQTDDPVADVRRAMAQRDAQITALNYEINSRDAHACHEAFMAGRKEAQDEWREIVEAAVETEQRWNPSGLDVTELRETLWGLKQTALEQVFALCIEVRAAREKGALP